MNAVSPIIETPEQHATPLKNLEHVRDLRELVVKERSLARSAFERLTNNQKRYLLIASGIESTLTDWNRLTDNDVKALLAGVHRLKVIISEYVNCDNQDFCKPHVN